MWSVPILAVVALSLTSTIDAAPKLNNFGQISRYPSFTGDVMESILMAQKPVRNFDLLKLGGGYGFVKRLQPQSKYETKTEKHRRGPLNGLIPGGAFGRALRSNLISSSEPLNYDKIAKILREAQFFGELPPYLPFDVESRNDSTDGQVVKGFIDKENSNPSSVDFYTSNQYKHPFTME